MKNAFKKVYAVFLSMAVFVCSLHTTSFALSGDFSLAQGFAECSGKESFVRVAPVVYTFDNIKSQGGLFYSTFSLVEYDGCFGNQLGAVSKEMYDSLVEHYVIQKNTGDCTHSMITDLNFEVVYKNGSYVRTEELLSLLDYAFVCLTQAYVALFADYPSLFWMSRTSLGFGYGLDLDNGRISEVTISTVESYKGAVSHIESFNSAVDFVCDEIKEAVGSSASRYEIVKYIHDYICKNAHYSYRFKDESVYTSQPFFMSEDKGMVCQGYAEATKLLCEEFSIPCVDVFGVAGERHMWNYILMDDGKWYLYDATWDDADVAALPDYVEYTYFLVGWDCVDESGHKISESRHENSSGLFDGMIDFVNPVISLTAYDPDNSQPVCNHESVDGDRYAKPTCTTSGYIIKTYVCDYCREEVTSVTAAAALGHDFRVASAKYYTGNSGVVAYSCNACGEKKAEQVSFSFEYVKAVLRDAENTISNKRLSAEERKKTEAALEAFNAFAAGYIIIDESGEVLQNNLPFEDEKVMTEYHQLLNDLENSVYGRTSADEKTPVFEIMDLQIFIEKIVQFMYRVFAQIV